MYIVTDMTYGRSDVLSRKYGKYYQDLPELTSDISNAND